MASTNKTPNLDLNQWLATDKPNWTVDLNNDLKLIDDFAGETKEKQQETNQGIQSNKRDINQNKSDISNLQAQDTAFAEQITEIQSKDTEQDAQIEKLTNDYTALSTTVKSNKTDTDTKIATINTELEQYNEVVIPAISSNISANLALINTNKDKIESNAGRIEAAEQKNTEQDTRLNRITDRLDNANNAGWWNQVSDNSVYTLPGVDGIDVTEGVLFELGIGAGDAYPVTHLGIAVNLTGLIDLNFPKTIMIQMNIRDRSTSDLASAQPQQFAVLSKYLDNDKNVNYKLNPVDFLKFEMPVNYGNAPDNVALIPLFFSRTGCPVWASVDYTYDPANHVLKLSIAQVPLTGGINSVGNTWLVQFAVNDPDTGKPDIDRRIIEGALGIIR